MPFLIISPEPAPFSYLQGVKAFLTGFVLAALLTLAATEVARHSHFLALHQALPPLHTNYDHR